MKVNRLMIELLKLKITKDNAKIVKKFHLDPKFKKKEDIPYIDDNNFYHQYDVLYGVGKKKNVCIIDIHGGSYIFGNRKENHHFASYFLERGFDFITIDYIANKGKRGHSILY